MSDTKDPKPSTAQQLADIALAGIRAGGIGIGGLGAMWCLFIESDIPKALASAGIGAILSYATSFVKPIDEGNKRRAEKSGQAVDGALDQTLEKMGHQIASTVLQGEEKYLQCQAWDCQQYKTKGLKPYDKQITLLLEEVFVPLALDVSCQDPRLLSVFKFDQDPERPQEIWDFLKLANQQPMFRQMVILAWGGYGKTTLLRHVTYKFCKKQQGKYGVPPRIPILLVLRKLMEKRPGIFRAEDPPSLPTLIEEYHIPNLPTDEVLRLPLNWAKTLLREGKAVVLLDGFDEVSRQDRPGLSKWLMGEMRRYQKTMFIVTSRPKAYQDQDDLEMSTVIWVRPFNQEQWRQFVTNWYRCQEQMANGGRKDPGVLQEADKGAANLLAQIEDPERDLTKLARNPLLLTMMASFHRAFEGADLPQRRVELYGDICQLQLKDRPRSRNIQTLLRECDAQTILQMLALDMMKRTDPDDAEKVQTWVERQELVGQLGEYLQSHQEAVDPKEFLQQVVEISELLVEVEKDQFHFAHLSFQEYLAAVEINRSQDESLIYEHLHNDQWKPLILMYAGLVKDPNPLLREMIDRNARDLARLCLKETRKRVDPQIKAALEGSKYQNLEEYLKQQRWQDADKETYRLMITEVGKEEGQWFDQTDLLNFPCEPLRTIDQLWRTYSQDRFGFSIQKEIYLECGGIPDGQYDRDAWDKFCHAVGWQVNNNYVSVNWGYVSVKFETASPRGHLPRSMGLWLWRWDLGEWWYSSLASRLVNCSL